MKRDEFLNDSYAQLARKKGIPARSYYKLEGIDKRFSLIAPEQRLLELGAHPGGWLKYLEHRTKGNASIYALDLKSIQQANFSFKTFKYLECDVEKFTSEALQTWSGGSFHGVLSDLAPNTTGIKDLDAMRSYELVEQGLKLACKTLRIGGFWVAKYYEGIELSEILQESRKFFSSVTTFKSKVTRSSSREIFIIARNFQVKTD